MKIKRLPGIPYILRLLNPTESICVNCGLPFNHCKIIKVAKPNFDLSCICEDCFDKMNMQERLITHINQFYNMRKVSSYGKLLGHADTEYIATIIDSVYYSRQPRKYNDVKVNSTIFKSLDELHDNPNLNIHTTIITKFTWLPRLYKNKVFWMEPVIIYKKVKNINKNYKVFKLSINIEYKREVIIDIN